MYNIHGWENSHYYTRIEKPTNSKEKSSATYSNIPTHLIKFLLRIRGDLTAAPTRELPVSQMPHAAPTTEKPKPKAIPKLAYP